MPANLNSLIKKGVSQIGTYKGNASHYHRLSENIASVASEFGLHNGFFGTRGIGGSASIRNIESDDPEATAKEFYDKLAHGGIENPLYKKDGSPNGFQTKMADGSIINWRPSSSSDGSPAVDIFVTTIDENGSIKTQKIHFIRRSDEDD